MSEATITNEFTNSILSLDGLDMAFYRAARAWIEDIHKLVADFTALRGTESHEFLIVLANK